MQNITFIYIIFLGLYGWNCFEEIPQETASTFDFPVQIGWKYFKYLGVKIYLGIHFKEVWKAIIQKLKKKIGSWGSFWLNLVGKIILIKSVLSALSSYMCSGFVAPKSIKKQISIMIRKFLW